MKGKRLNDSVFIRHSCIVHTTDLSMYIEVCVHTSPTVKKTTLIPVKTEAGIFSLKHRLTINILFLVWWESQLDMLRFSALVSSPRSTHLSSSSQIAYVTFLSPFHTITLHFENMKVLQNQRRSYLRMRGRSSFNFHIKVLTVKAIPSNFSSLTYYVQRTRLNTQVFSRVIL